MERQDLPDAEIHADSEHIAPDERPRTEPASVGRERAPHVTTPEAPPQRPFGRRVVSGRVLLVFFVALAAGVAAGVLVPERLPGMRAVETQPRTFLPTTTAADIDVEVSTVDTVIDVEEGGYDVSVEVGTLPTEDLETYLAWMTDHTNESVEHLEARWDLAQLYISTGELQGEAISAFLKTPREIFVRPHNLSRAYDDSWLPIAHGVTITDPDVVSMMTTTLSVEPHHRVLEIGTGSGYQSAILSRLTNECYSIEIIEPMYHDTNELYRGLYEEYPTYRNIRRKLGDGFYGWEKYAPFDRIIVTASIDHLPPPLLQQLAPGGIMVIPLGPPSKQFIIEVKKLVDDDGNIELTRRDVYNGLSVRFIPFIDDQGNPRYNAPNS